jgi:hypothetical protein
MAKLRHQLSPTHPVVGRGYRLLTDDDILAEGDETACVSCLLSPRGDSWMVVTEEWAVDFGKTIRAVCDDGDDADGHERVFRRRVGEA